MVSQVVAVIVLPIPSGVVIQDGFGTHPWWRHGLEDRREGLEIWEGPWDQYLFEGSWVSIVVVVVALPASGPVLGVVITAPAVVFVVAAAGGHSGQSPLQVAVVGIQWAVVALGGTPEALVEVAVVSADAGTTIAALAQ